MRKRGKRWESNTHTHTHTQYNLIKKDYEIEAIHFECNYHARDG